MLLSTLIFIATQNSESLLAVPINCHNLACLHNSIFAEQRRATQGRRFELQFQKMMITQLTSVLVGIFLLQSTVVGKVTRLKFLALD